MLVGGLAAACVPFEKSSPFWGTIGAGFRKNRGPVVDPEYVRKLPYASMMAWFDGGPKALVVLGEVTGDNRYTWYTAERQSLTTFGPFIVGALGFDIDLRSTIFGGGWLPNPLDLIGARLVRSLDVQTGADRVQVPLSSTFAATETEAVEILGETRQLKRVTEALRYAGRRRFKNEYWIETSTGRCWKSRQLAIPTLPPINLEVTKYPTV